VICVFKLFLLPVLLNQNIFCAMHAVIQHTKQGRIGGVEGFAGSRGRKNMLHSDPLFFQKFNANNCYLNRITD